MSNWKQVAMLDEVPVLGSRVVKSDKGDIALFRTQEGEVFALQDKCPHKGGHLSQGIVFGKKVACPLHNWHIQLESGIAVAPDEGCAASFPVKVEAGKIFLSLTPNAGCPNH